MNRETKFIGIKSIFFDIDGTLTFAKKPNFEVFWDVLQNKGLKSVSLKQAEEAFENTKKIYLEQGWKWKENPGQVYRDLNKMQLEHCGIAPTKALVDAIQNAYRDAKNEALFEDVVPTLQLLRNKNLVLGTLTGGLKVDVEHRLDILSVKSFFKFIEATGTREFSKPDQKAFEFILNLVKVKPEEMIYVGNDYEMDVTGADKVGIKGVLIDRAKKYEGLSCVRITDMRKILGFV
ncbi:MAG: HAD family hydrolase [Patescibacteria group bacterium]